MTAQYNPAMRGEETIEQMKGDGDLLSKPLVQKLIEDFRKVCDHRKELIQQNTDLAMLVFELKAEKKDG